GVSPPNSSSFLFSPSSASSSLDILPIASSPLFSASAHSGSSSTPWFFGSLARTLLRKCVFSSGAGTSPPSSASPGMFRTPPCCHLCASSALRRCPEARFLAVAKHSESRLPIADSACCRKEPQRQTRAFPLQSAPENDINLLLYSSSEPQKKRGPCP